MNLIALALGFAVTATAAHGLAGDGSNEALPARLGEYYEATVPDTVDLAERAGYGVNHFTSVISVEEDYEMYWSGGASGMGYQWSPLFACQPKAMEALAFERVMSGSTQNLELESKMVEMLASHIGEEGIYWGVIGGGKPWFGDESWRPLANVHGQGRMIRAMIVWYQYTGDPAWVERIDRMVDGLDRTMVVHKDDYAYFPVFGWLDEDYFRSCYMKGRGWRDTVEPRHEKDGEEGSLFNHQGHTAGALANWYALTGNEQALRLAGEFVRFLMKPKFWADRPEGEYPGVVGAEHAHWQGHWHGHINVLRAILEVALVTDDLAIQEFVREGYEWARAPWFSRAGFVGDGQGCGLGRLIGLAVKLTEAGIGDYWEDIDLYIRNNGVEQQFTPDDVPFLLAQRGNPPPEGRDDTAMNAMIGGFNANPTKTNWALCCSPHGNMGLFYAWDGMLRHTDDVVRVNLLLNRASPWMDVESHLPYQGKVVLRNKTARAAYLRIPLWVDMDELECRVGDASRSVARFGRYVAVTDLNAGDTVTLEFPMSERTETWTTPGQLWGWWPGHPAGTEMTCRFKGNTLIQISPTLTQGSPTPDGSVWWPYSNRAEKYAAETAPMKQVTRFVTDHVFKW